MAHIWKRLESSIIKTGVKGTLRNCDLTASLCLFKIKARPYYHCVVYFILVLIAIWSTFCASKWGRQQFLIKKNSCTEVVFKTNLVTNPDEVKRKGSGCGAVGRAVAFNTRGPRFDSSHRLNFIEHLFIINSIEKTKINKKEAGNGPLFLKKKQAGCPVVVEVINFF